MTPKQAYAKAKKLIGKHAHVSFNPKAPDASEKAAMNAKRSQLNARIKELENQIAEFKRSRKRGLMAELKETAGMVADLDGDASTIAPLKAVIQAVRDYDKLNDELQDLREQVKNICTWVSRCTIGKVNDVGGIQFSHTIAYGDTWEEAFSRLPADYLKRQTVTA